jgi:hypothetical protein
MPRPKQEHCPIAGCKKRGRREDLMRHASAKHADIDAETYRQILINGKTLSHPPLAVFRSDPNEPATLGWIARWLAVRVGACAAIVAMVFIALYLFSTSGIK